MSGPLEPKPARVLIVDDHPIVRRGLAKAVDEAPDMEVCGEVSDASEALRFLEKDVPDVAIVDISLEKGISGVELVKEIVNRWEEVRILVCSVHDEKLYAERCLNAGARGYITKTEPPEHILEAIRQVRQGKVYLSEEMSDRFLTRMVGGDEGFDKPSIDALSDRELEVFEMIGRGQTTRQIAQNLHLSMKTIETYRENIKVKLGLANSTELIRHAVQWVLTDR